MPFPLVPPRREAARSCALNNKQPAVTTSYTKSRMELPAARMYPAGREIQMPKPRLVLYIIVIAVLFAVAWSFLGAEYRATDNAAAAPPSAGRRALLTASN